METLCPVNSETDASARITDAIRKLPEGDVLRLSPGEYPLRHPVEINGKKDITVDGTGATIICHYDPEDPLVKSSEGFHVTRSERITLRGFTLTTSAPAAVLTHIVGFSEDHIDVKFDCGYTPTCREFIQSAHADNGHYTSDQPDESHYGRIIHLWPKPRDPNACVCFANEIVTTNSFAGIGINHEWLDDRTLRLLDVKGEYWKGMKVGMRCNISFSYYGLCAMVFRNVSGMTVEDVTVPRFGGMCFVVLPRCRDFTFRNVKVAQPSLAEAFDSISSDCIHTTGLGGYLKILGCTFNYTRDDPLNLHTQFLTITEIADRKIHVIYNKPHGNVSPDWIAEGDRLQVYDPVRCSPKGYVIAKALTIVSGENGRREGDLELECAGCDMRPGDLIDNTFYYPDLTIKNCYVESYRRGFVIQSASSVLVKDNEFVGGTMNVYISANYGQYLEAGHVSNAIIENNRFTGTRGDAVMIRVGGPGSLAPVGCHTVPVMVHRNIAIRGNKFTDNEPAPQINANGTDGLEIIGNVFHNSGESPLAVDQCAAVKIRDNRVSR